jgi:hypothetical protein
MTSKIVDWNQRAMDMLADIQSGKMKLEDAPLATSADGVQSFTDSGSSNPPVFKKDQDGW